MPRRRKGRAKRGPTTSLAFAQWMARTDLIVDLAFEVELFRMACAHCGRPLVRKSPKDNLCEACLAGFRHELLAREERLRAQPTRTPASTIPKWAVGNAETTPVRFVRWED